MKPAVTASASIMSWLPNGFDTIEYTKYTVQINNAEIMIQRKIFPFLDIRMTSYTNSYLSGN